VLARRWGAYAKLLGDKHAANAVLNQIAVYLWTKMVGRLFEPIENLPPALVSQSGDCGRDVCFTISQFPNFLLA
jgi:hypothetical protein